MKHTLFLITAIFIFIQSFAQTPVFEWAERMGGTGMESGNSIITDASGNVYTCGSFEGTADFDPGTATYNLTSSGSSDIFISKLDAYGKFCLGERNWRNL